MTWKTYIRSTRGGLGALGGPCPPWGLPLPHLHHRARACFFPRDTNQRIQTGQHPKKRLGGAGWKGKQKENNHSQETLHFPFFFFLVQSCPNSFTKWQTAGQGIPTTETAPLASHLCKVL